MKIIQIIPDLNLGGAERMCELLSNELVTLGHDVIVVSLFSDETLISKRMINNGIDVRFLDKKKGLDLSMIKKLKELFLKEKPDVIHTHRHLLQYTFLAARFSGIKNMVHTFHSIAKEEQTNKIMRKLCAILYKYNLVKPVALSDVVKSTILEEYKLLSKQVPIIANGIDLSQCIQKKSYDIKDNITIIHVGRFSDVKNHPDLIKAFKKFHDKYKNSILKLIGDGEERQKIEKLVETEGLKSSVQFCGVQENVHVLLEKADIFALVSKYEGIPLALAEAMGDGLPIVATNVGGVPDMIKNDYSGLLVDIDVNMISDAFIKFAENKTLREFCGKNALKDSKKYSVEEMAKRYVEIYGR